MNERRFHAGDVFSIPPMQYRIVPGTKRAAPGETDLRLDWRYVGEWQSVTLDSVALILDAIAENENVALFPPPRYKGNAYVVEFAKRAIRDGHGPARCWLQELRARKHDPGAYA
jgi:hypothetical protein